MGCLEQSLQPSRNPLLFQGGEFRLSKAHRGPSGRLQEQEPGHPHEELTAVSHWPLAPRSLLRPPSLPSFLKLPTSHPTDDMAFYGPLSSVRSQVFHCFIFLGIFEAALVSCDCPPPRKSERPQGVLASWDQAQKSGKVAWRGREMAAREAFGASGTAVPPWSLPPSSVYQVPFSEGRAKPLLPWARTSTTGRGREVGHICLTSERHPETRLHRRAGGSEEA